MALKDCIRKVGKVSDDDQALLTSYLADGLSDEQAVRKLLLSAYRNVVDIADRARGLGATVEKKTDLLAEVKSIQAANLEAVRKQREEINQSLLTLDLRLDDIEVIQSHVIHGSGATIDIGDRQALLRRLSELLFGNELFQRLAAR